MTLIIVFLQETKASLWWLTETFDFSDGARLTWNEPPPTQTVQAVGHPVDHLSRRKLIEGTRTANFSWNFNLTELKFSFLTLAFKSKPYAIAWPSGLVVQHGLRNYVKITRWIPRRISFELRLVIFRITDGAFTCIVNANKVKGNVSFPFGFHSNIQVDVVGKLKVKSIDIYIYIYIYIYI